MELKDKTKGRAGRIFPITFVVDQQLEACVLAIRQKPRYYAIDLIRYTVEILDEHTEPDSVGFITTVFRIGSSAPVMQVYGTFRRWEGTSTRVEGDITILNRDIANSIVGVGCIVFFAGVAVTLMPVTPAIFVILDILNREELIYAEPHPIVVIVGFIALCLMILLAYRYFNRRWLIWRLRKMVKTGIVRH